MILGGIQEKKILHQISDKKTILGEIYGKIKGFCRNFPLTDNMTDSDL